MSIAFDLWLLSQPDSRLVQVFGSLYVIAHTVLPLAFSDCLMYFFDFRFLGVATSKPSLELFSGPKNKKTLNAHILKSLLAPNGLFSNPLQTRSCHWCFWAKDYDKEKCVRTCCWGWQVGWAANGAGPAATDFFPQLVVFTQGLVPLLKTLFNLKQQTFRSKLWLTNSVPSTGASRPAEE